MFGSYLNETQVCQHHCLVSKELKRDYHAVNDQIQVYLIITLPLGSIEKDRVISETVL